MQIKSGILLKILVPVVVLVVTMIGVKSCGSQKSAQPQSGNTGAAALTREELSLLGIEGDTPQDTLRTLLGRIKTIQKNQDTLETQSRALTAENDRLRAQGENVEARISEAVAAVSQENTLAQQQLADEQQRLTDLLESLLSAPPVSRNSADSVLPAEPPETVWTEPQDSQPTISGSAPGSPALFPAAFGSAEDNAITRQKAELDRTAKQQTADVPGTPVYTVPENATLTGSRAMTALLGRIPADGKVTDPYPFKILIGRENLTANGIELPNLAGAVVSGTATGDWVLSCVRGEVHSMTFVFTDGTVRTVLQAGKQGEGRSHRGCGISLAPFADAHKLAGMPQKSGELSDDIGADDAETEERDILGELEIVARLMITGGEAKEEARLARADRGMMREAILTAAQQAKNAHRQMITADLQAAFYAFAGDPARPEARRTRAQNMGESLSVFMQGFLGELFNREGRHWPEADITLIDLGTLAREGYEAPLAVAYTSLVNTINNIAERD